MVQEIFCPDDAVRVLQVPLSLRCPLGAVYWELENMEVQCQIPLGHLSHLGNHGNSHDPEVLQLFTKGLEHGLSP